ncbi:hypothetical protein AltI4_00830 [Alteromonas sp. I4]|nr:hypothetical protein AltI4_00830 [Alteromonas sp. I4]
MFEVGKEYHRRTDLHEKYGGQRQGGISTPQNYPFIFIFTSDSGEWLLFVQTATEKPILI